MRFGNHNTEPSFIILSEFQKTTDKGILINDCPNQFSSRDTSFSPFHLMGHTKEKDPDARNRETSCMNCAKTRLTSTYPQVMISALSTTMGGSFRALAGGFQGLFCHATLQNSTISKVGILEKVSLFPGTA